MQGRRWNNRKQGCEGYIGIKINFSKHAETCLSASKINVPLGLIEWCSWLKRSCEGYIGIKNNSSKHAEIASKHNLMTMFLWDSQNGAVGYNRKRSCEGYSGIKINSSKHAETTRYCASQQVNKCQCSFGTHRMVQLVTAKRRCESIRGPVSFYKNPMTQLLIEKKCRVVGWMVDEIN